MAEPRRKSIRQPSGVGNRPYLSRWRFPLAFFLAAVLFFLVRTAALQLVEKDGQLSGAAAKTALTEERVTVKAARGSICDRNGTPLVSTQTSYRAVYTPPEEDGTEKTEEEKNSENDALNEELYSVLSLLYAGGREYSPTVLPETETEEGTVIVATAKMSEQEYNDYAAFTEAYGIPAYTDYDTFIELLRDLYGTYRMELDGDSEFLMVKLRYELDCAARADREYVFCEDCDTSFMASVMETRLSCVELRADVHRVYHYPGHATHILGRVGKIQAEDLEYYEELGYPMDAVVGVDGAEEAFETVLAGEDGVMVRQIDQYGNVVRTYMEKETVAGKNVYLTIDIDLQIAAEASLKNNILKIRELAKTSGETLHGEDASAGALILLSPATGEVLAMASYPTYNLANFSRDYSALLESKNKPLLNRCLSGTYAPGSVFKLCTATAALENGIIDLETTVFDEGVYRYYDDYQPKCWIYTRTGGGTHGEETVQTALRDSCNYFFFDVGRQVGITSLVSWARAFGLGESTGIELPEQTGVVAGAALGGWSAGDTLSAAIGQNVHRYTPLQIAQFYATFVNGGTRIGAHLYYKTTEFLTNEETDRYTPEVLSSTPISDTTRQALLSGMNEVIDNGSAVSIFRDCAFTVGGKTGTAEVGENQSANALFAAFSPQENPEVVSVSVIENGASGTNASYAVRDLLTAYYEQKTS